MNNQCPCWLADHCPEVLIQSGYTEDFVVRNRSDRGLEKHTLCDAYGNEIETDTPEVVRERERREHIALMIEQIARLNHDAEVLLTDSIGARRLLITSRRASDSSEDEKGVEVPDAGEYADDYSDSDYF